MARNFAGHVGDDVPARSNLPYNRLPGLHLECGTPHNASNGKGVSSGPYQLLRKMAATPGQTFGKPPAAGPSPAPNRFGSWTTPTTV